MFLASFSLPPPRQLRCARDNLTHNVQRLIQGCLAVAAYRPLVIEPSLKKNPELFPGREMCTLSDSVSHVRDVFDTKCHPSAGWSQQPQGPGSISRGTQNRLEPPGSNLGKLHTTLGHLWETTLPLLQALSLHKTKKTFNKKGTGAQR